MSIVALIHPPTLNASLWDPLAAALRQAGHEVVVPDYSAELAEPRSWWRRATLTSVKAIEAAVGAGKSTAADKTGARDYVASAPGADVLVAFSSAGLLTPLICASRHPQRVVFLDAEVPGETKSAPSAALAEQASEGVEVVALPEGFFAEPVGTTPEWEPARVDYVQLSGAYAGHAGAARKRGWAVVETDLGHLSMVSDTEAVLATLDLSP